MILTREQLEQEEMHRLAGYAVQSSQSQGRNYAETFDPYRTAFQRDRDRIIHSKAFRRSRGKTQVFVAHYGDHYRSRMAHSMEVAQISRDIARTLGLNEDLAEAIALAHDLGHTPFGHAGEYALNTVMERYGFHFEHNEQSLRVVELLEYRYADFVGLNLSYEVRDGLIKHRTSYDNPHLVDHPMSSLEAQVVNLADEIAYQNHDIDDALRSGIVTVAQMNQLALWQRAQKEIPVHLGDEVFIAMTISALIKLMIEDVYQATEKNFNLYEIKTLDQVYQMKNPLIVFSPEMQGVNDELKRFLYDHFYHSPRVARYNEEGALVIQVLFDYFFDHFDEIPFDSRVDLSESKAILIKDYIAGMTDHFALEFYNKIKRYAVS